MIRATVDLLVSQLNQYVSLNTTGDPVVAGNISFLESDGGAGGGSVDTDRIIVSLVNVQEEGALKNGSNLRTIGSDSFYERRPVFLNLFLLFSAHFTNYPTALNALTQVIEFFQANAVFSYQRTPPNTGIPTDPRDQQLQAQLDLHTLNFQEINDLWGSLGGKQVPFVMYKARVLPIQARTPMEQAKPISRIDIDAGDRR